MGWEWAGELNQEILQEVAELVLPILDPFLEWAEGGH